jgi:hypothetical protein
MDGRISGVNDLYMMQRVNGIVISSRIGGSMNWLVLWDKSIAGACSPHNESFYVQAILFQSFLHCP